MKLDFDRSKLRDSKNAQRTQSLFFEYYIDNAEAVFTTKDDDYTVNGTKYLSLKKIYLEIADPTEYEFAITVFGNWRHWQRLTRKFLKAYVEVWRSELSVKLRSKAIKQAMSNAKSGNFNAAKWVADKGWESKRGRPSKKEKAQIQAEDKQVSDDIQSDLRRLNLTKPTPELTQ